MTSLAEAAETWRTQRNIARSEALLEAERSIEKYRADLQGRVVGAIRAGRKISDISRETGLGRSTIYKWRDQHAEATSGASEVESEWAVGHFMSGEFRVTHPVLGSFMASADPDEGPLVWSSEGIYAPISPGDAGWTKEHESLLPHLIEAHNAWVAEGSKMVWHPENQNETET